MALIHMSTHRYTCVSFTYHSTHPHVYTQVYTQIHTCVSFTYLFISHLYTPYVIPFEDIQQSRFPGGNVTESQLAAHRGAVTAELSAVLCL